MAERGKSSGFFEGTFTPHAQSELLAVFVWGGAAVLAICSVKYWRQGLYWNFRTVLLPVGHVLPWLMAYKEGIVWYGDSNDDCDIGSNGLHFRQSFLRVLWVLYIILSVVEYELY